jgi:DNA-directed RNA polymerase specialized sigma24 family protein
MAHGSPQFDSTLWSQVLLAAREPDSAGGRQALGRLCSAYWYPVYAYVRRRGASPDDAQDLTQGFFQHILSSGFFARVDPGRGKFRSFLLGAVGNYLGDERDKRMSQRRGGGREEIPIDATVGEQWLSVEPSAANDSTRAFDRSWATAVINNAMTALEREQVDAGKSQAFGGLKEFLQRPAMPGEYDEVAAKLNLSKGAVAATVHRLNERFGELVRKSVRDTISDPEMAEEELRFLHAALHN